MLCTGPEISWRVTVCSRRQRSLHRSNQHIQYHCWERIQYLLTEEPSSTSIELAQKRPRSRAHGRRRQTYNLTEEEVKILMEWEQEGVLNIWKRNLEGTSRNHYPPFYHVLKLVSSLYHILLIALSSPVLVRPCLPPFFMVPFSSIFTILVFVIFMPT